MTLDIIAAARGVLPLLIETVNALVHFRGVDVFTSGGIMILEAVERRCFPG